MENKNEKLFTVEEAKLLYELLDNLNVKPRAPDALKSVALVQSIAKKIEALTETKEAKC